MKNYKTNKKIKGLLFGIFSFLLACSYDNVNHNGQKISRNHSTHKKHHQMKRTRNQKRNKNNVNTIKEIPQNSLTELGTKLNKESKFGKKRISRNRHTNKNHNLAKEQNANGWSDLLCHLTSILGIAVSSGFMYWYIMGFDVYVDDYDLNLNNKKLLCRVPNIFKCMFKNCNMYSTISPYSTVYYMQNYQSTIFHEIVNQLIGDRPGFCDTKAAEFVKYLTKQCDENTISKKDLKSLLSCKCYKIIYGFGRTALEYAQYCDNKSKSNPKATKYIAALKDLYNVCGINPDGSNKDIKVVDGDDDDEKQIKATYKGQEYQFNAEFGMFVFSGKDFSKLYELGGNRGENILHKLKHKDCKTNSDCDKQCAKFVGKLYEKFHTAGNLCDLKDLLKEKSNQSGSPTALQFVEKLDSDRMGNYHKALKAMYDDCGIDPDGMEIQDDIKEEEEEEDIDSNNNSGNQKISIIYERDSYFCEIDFNNKNLDLDFDNIPGYCCKLTKDLSFKRKTYLFKKHDGTWTQGQELTSSKKINKQYFSTINDNLKNLSVYEFMDCNDYNHRVDFSKNPTKASYFGLNNEKYKADCYELYYYPVKAKTENIYIDRRDNVINNFGSVACWGEVTKKSNPTYHGRHCSGSEKKRIEFNNFSKQDSEQIEKAYQQNKKKSTK